MRRSMLWLPHQWLLLRQLRRDPMRRYVRSNEHSLSPILSYTFFHFILRHLLPQHNSSAQLIWLQFLLFSKNVKQEKQRKTKKKVSRNSNFWVRKNCTNLSLWNLKNRVNNSSSNFHGKRLLRTVSYCHAIDLRNFSRMAISSFIP